MRRRFEPIILLIERTVPVLVAIGAVLSVLLLLFRDTKWLYVPCIAVWGLAFLAAAGDLVFALILRKNSPSDSVCSRDEASRDRILSEVAHELKTPLTVIRGSVEILSDGAVPAEQYPEYYARILRETDAMTKLVSDLLDATREASSMRFDPQPTDLVMLGQWVCDDLKQTAASSGVDLTFVAKSDIPLLRVDPDRVGQLAVILLDNAVKHTPAGGRVCLSLDRTSRFVLLEVRDNGSGIPSEDLPYIFDRYYKVPVERTGLASGTGIGLSVAKKIADLHGGTIDVKSEVGKGSLFTVRFPLSTCKVN